MYGKLIIRCKLKVLTGMHIGGSSAFSAIGAVDSPVQRDPRTGMPIVPGSSLKGKLRTLLVRSLTGDIANMPKHNDDDPRILRLFGASSPIIKARLQFADAFVANDEHLPEKITEVKHENTIDRRSAVANPRQIERVISGVRFSVNIVYDLRDGTSPEELRDDFALLAKAMRLLQLDYLGGHGTRGSGRVSFEEITLTPAECAEPIADYDCLLALLKDVEQYALLSI